MPSRKPNLADQVNELELGITKLLQEGSPDQSVNEMRNHLIDVYTRVGVGLIKRHQSLIE